MFISQQIQQVAAIIMNGHPGKTTTNGVYHPSGWVTVTIPLTSITAATYTTGWQYNPTGTPPSKVTDLTGASGTDQLFAYFTNFHVKRYKWN